MSGVSDVIEFSCGHCRVRLKVKASASGQSVSCPKCQATLTVPAPSRSDNASASLLGSGRAGSFARQPLGDPPQSEMTDPQSRISELSVQNRELQEKLRQKETELELARLKLAEVDRKDVSPLPASPPPSPERPSENSSKTLWVVAAMVMVFLVGVVLFKHSMSMPSPPHPTAGKPAVPLAGGTMGTGSGESSVPKEKEEPSAAPSPANSNGMSSPITPVQADTPPAGTSTTSIVVAQTNAVLPSPADVSSNSASAKP